MKMPKLHGMGKTHVHEGEIHSVRHAHPGDIPISDGGGGGGSGGGGSGGGGSGGGGSGGGSGGGGSGGGGTGGSGGSGSFGGSSSSGGNNTDPHLTTGTTTNPYGTDPVYYSYSQSSGVLTLVDAATGQSTVVGTGYAGNGSGLDNPDAQGTKSVGPLPQGTYTINGATNGTHMGPEALGLTPNASNNMYGRSGFYMHGDNAAQNDSASNGCVIMDNAVRTSVANNGITTLVVTH